MSASQGRVAAVASAVALAGGVVIGAATPAAAADPVASLVPTRTLASGWLSSVVRSTDQPLATGLSRSGAVDGVPSYSVRTSLTAPPGWPSGVQVVGVAAETDASIALGSDGAVYGIGAVGGQATDTLDDVHAFTAFPGLPAGVGAASLSAAPYATYVIGTDGVPYAAGRADREQLGGGLGDHGLQQLTAVTGLPAGVRAVQMDGNIADASGGYTLVLGSDGIVYGAGVGPCGAQNAADGPGVVPIFAPLNGVTAVQVAAGDGFVLELGADGNLYGCGLDADGQLTTGARGSSIAGMDLLDPLPDGAQPVSIDAGYGSQGRQSVVLGSNGTVYVAGDVRAIDPADPLGSALTWRALPRPAGAGRIVEAVSGDDDVLMRDEHGGVWGVGQNYYLELDGRLGGTADRYGPTAHPLAGQSLLSTAKPGLFGTARVGSALYATAGSWDLAPTGYSYQWFRDGHPVAGAAAGTHLLTASDRGHRLSVSVTVSAPGMTSATATSTSSALVGVAPALRRPPHVPYLSGKG